MTSRHRLDSLYKALWLPAVYSTSVIVTALLTCFHSFYLCFFSVDMINYNPKLAQIFQYDELAKHMFL